MAEMSKIGIRTWHLPRRCDHEVINDGSGPIFLLKIVGFFYLINEPKMVPSYF